MLDVPLLLASAAGASTYVRDLLVVLLAAAAVSITAPRLRLPSIPGYLVVGALLGYLHTGSESMDENIGNISNIAIILLMFTIGLHLDTAAIRGGMVSILAVGLASTIGASLLGWPIAMGLGLGAPAGLAAAMALSMSSTAVVLGLLQQRREVHRVHGRLCIGIELVQDLLSIAVLALLPPLAIWAGARSSGQLSHAAAPGSELPPGVRELADGALALGSIGVMLAGARYLLPRALREASRGGNHEALLVVSSTAALAAAVVTTLLGLGPALGAFLAGFILASTPFRHQLAGQLSPLRDLFMAVFFTAIGIELDLGPVLTAWWLVLLIVLAVTVIKAGVIGLCTWGGGATVPVAVVTALALAHGGEFSIVIIKAAEEAGIFTGAQTSTLIGAVVVSLIVAAPLFDLGKKIAPRFSHLPPARWITNPSLREPHEQPRFSPPGGIAPGGADGAAAPPAQKHVIIAGFGVVGRNLAEHFAVAGIPFAVVELNPATVVRQQRLGRQTVYGDISNPDVLESAGIRHADAVILTIPDDDATLRACRTIRQTAPDVFIAARTSYLSRAIAATEMGADHVTVEEVVTAQDMARQVMDRLAKRHAARPVAPVPHL